MVESLEIYFLLFVQDTRIRVVDRDHQSTGSRLTLINPGNGDSASHVFIGETPEVLQEWLDALWQHIYDQSEFFLLSVFKYLHLIHGAVHTQMC